ncbi:MAG: M23 family metallopeptidase [Actinomycetota bacterium]
MRPSTTRLRTAAGVVSLVVVATLATPTATAQAGPEDTKRKVDASIGAVKDDLDETDAALTSAYFALQKTQSQLPGARATLATAEQAESDAVERDHELGRRLEVSKAAEGKAVDALAGTARDAAATTTLIGGIARQAYQTAGMGEISVALQAQSADDFATRVVLVDTALRIQGDALARLAVLRADTSAARSRLTAVRRQSALLKAQAVAHLAQTQAATRAAAAAKAGVDALLARQGSQVATVAARKRAERARLDALQAQSKQLGAQLAEIARQARIKAARDRAARAAAAARAREAVRRKRAAAARERARAARAARSANRSSGSASSGSSDGPSGSSSPSPSPGGFTSSGYLTEPVDNAYVTSEFGMRFHPILHYWRLHAGIDFGVACGTPVHAAAEGQVVSAGWGGGYGNRIVVDHGLVGDVGLATTYNHLTSIVVPSGSVRRGQLIGYSGTTGSSTGCHLHFETYDNGLPVNPRKWL